MKKIILFSFVFALVFLFLTACGENSSTEDSDTPVTAGQNSEAPALAETEISSEPTASPETAAPSEPEQAGWEASSNLSISTDANDSIDPDRPSVQEPDSGDSDTENSGEFSFIGTVEDVSEHEMMISVTEGDIQNYGDSVLVSFPDDVDIQVHTGDTVKIRFDGIVMPSLPPRVSASGYEILEAAG